MTLQLSSERENFFFFWRSRVELFPYFYFYFHFYIREAIFHHQKWNWMRQYWMTHQHIRSLILRLIWFPQWRWCHSVLTRLIERKKRNLRRENCFQLKRILCLWITLCLTDGFGFSFNFWEFFRNFLLNLIFVDFTPPQEY